MREKKIDKKYFDVKVETMLPATVTYRVLAEDAQQACELLKNATPIQVKYKLGGKKDIKLVVYDAGSTMIRFIKRLMGV
jgi:hypothetical protein